MDMMTIPDLYIDERITSILTFAKLSDWELMNSNLHSSKDYDIYSYELTNSNYENLYVCANFLNGKFDNYEITFNDHFLLAYGNDVNVIQADKKEDYDDFISKLVSLL